MKLDEALAVVAEDCTGQGNLYEVDEDPLGGEVVMMCAIGGLAHAAHAPLAMLTSNSLQQAVDLVAEYYEIPMDAVDNIWVINDDYPNLTHRREAISTYLKDIAGDMSPLDALEKAVGQGPDMLQHRYPDTEED